MAILKTIFFSGLFLVFYSYLGYGILLVILVGLKRIFVPPKKNSSRELPLPDISIIIAAYNEEDFIETKINNTLSLDYPSEKVQLIVITDGSADNTPVIAGNFEKVVLLHQNERAGKIAAVHRAMQYVTSPIVIFSDANTLLNREALRNIVRHYEDPATGGVAGEKKIIDSQSTNGAVAGEGLYWKYESFLKKLDSQFYTVVGAAGELFSIRTALYEPVEKNAILDDFVISLRVCAKRYRIAYEPEAYAMESPSASIIEEKKRKIRISAGGFQSILMLKNLLNFFKYPVLSFQYVSHRVLRWAICPLLLPLIFILNIIIVANEGGVLYSSLLVLQVFFYIAAVSGLILMRRNIKIKALYVPYYFLFINYCLYIGFFRFIKGRQTVLWEKAYRENSMIRS